MAAWDADVGDEDEAQMQSGLTSAAVGDIPVRFVVENRMDLTFPAPLSPLLPSDDGNEQNRSSGHATGDASAAAGGSEAPSESESSAPKVAAAPLSGLSARLAGLGDLTAQLIPADGKFREHGGLFDGVKFLP